MISPWLWAQVLKPQHGSKSRHIFQILACTLTLVSALFLVPNQPLPEEITKFRTGFPLPKITLLNNSHHSWILNLLAAFSANQQSGTRLNKFYPDGAFIFYQILSCIFLKIHIIGTPKVKTWNQDSRSLRILSRECVFVFLCEFALFGPDLVSPFLGITLSRRAQILSEICRIVCLWKRQDIFPIHK